MTGKSAGGHPQQRWGNPMQRTISMLVADDSHVVQQIVIDAARASKLPLRISSTDNGRDCFTLLSGGNIDLAFIDVNMPELFFFDASGAAGMYTISLHDALPI